MMPENKDIFVSQLNDVVIDNHSRAWCKLAYPGHPNGCPNFGKRAGCPPHSLLFEQLVRPPFTLVAVKFNLEEHAKRMKEKHPAWSDRQARCVLYWQAGVDKRLREACEKTASEIPNSLIIYKPEAAGVHVFETCRKIGLVLERNPHKILWKVAIIGIKK